MGFRYRKSIKLGKGVRLNIGKTGVSISAGVPGFRKTIHSSGRVTTTVGIPGTGLYYVDTDHIGKKKQNNVTGGNTGHMQKTTPPQFYSLKTDDLQFTNLDVTNNASHHSLIQLTTDVSKDVSFGIDHKCGRE